MQMQNRVIVRWLSDYGRMGTLEGIFVCTKDELESLYGKDIYFGEVLGKHSDISVVIDEKEFSVLSEDPEFIAKFVEILGDGTISGYNPLDYLDEEDEAEED